MLTHPSRGPGSGPTLQSASALGHGLYFGRVVSLIGAALSDRDAYRYLPESAAYLPAADELQAMVCSFGFADVRRHRLSGGIAQLITATRSC